MHQKIPYIGFKYMYTDIGQVIYDIVHVCAKSSIVGFIPRILRTLLRHASGRRHLDSNRIWPNGRAAVLAQIEYAAEVMHSGCIVTILI